MSVVEPHLVLGHVGKGVPDNDSGPPWGRAGRGGPSGPLASAHHRSVHEFLEQRLDIRLI